MAPSDDIHDKESQMAPLVRFMVSPLGRIARVVAGIALIVGGLLAVTGTVGLIVAAVGLVPLIAGAIDVCVFAPLFGYPLSGPKSRAQLSA
jgi:hypothetical protein